MLSRQHVSGLLSLVLSALTVLPLGGLSAFLLEVVTYTPMYVNEIHSWKKQPLLFANTPPSFHLSLFHIFSALLFSPLILYTRPRK